MSIKTATLNGVATIEIARPDKKNALTVTVQEPIPADWKMLHESHPHSKAASNTAVWKIVVPAEGSVVLSYRVQVRL